MDHRGEDRLIPGTGKSFPRFLNNNPIPPFHSASLGLHPGETLTLYA
jgi:hypothetical protein